MARITIEDRFHGTCNLVILHLRRAAKSNDLEAGFDAARAMRMLTPDQEAFVRRCLALDDALRQGEASLRDGVAPRNGAPQPGEARQQGDDPDGGAVTDELIRELQACVLRLNTADPA